MCYGGNEHPNTIRTVSCNDDIIHIDKAKQSNWRSASNKHWCIVAIATHCIKHEKLDKKRRCLSSAHRHKQETENAQNFVATTQKYIQGAVQKGIVDIQSMQGPVLGNNNSKNETNSGILDNRTKGLCEVNCQKLVKTFGNKGILVMIVLKKGFWRNEPSKSQDMLYKPS